MAGVFVAAAAGAQSERFPEPVGEGMRSAEGRMQNVVGGLTGLSRRLIPRPTSPATAPSAHQPGSSAQISGLRQPGARVRLDSLRPLRARVPVGLFLQELRVCPSCHQRTSRLLPVLSSTTWWPPYPPALCPGHPEHAPPLLPAPPSPAKAALRFRPGEPGRIPPHRFGLPQRVFRASS